MDKRFFGRILKGAFLERPNRFTVLFQREGMVERAFLPNPGRLWELLLPGKTLYLEENKSKKKTPYTVVAVERDGRPVVLHTHRTNDVAEYLIGKGLVPGLNGALVVKREVRLKGSRFDFLLEMGGRRIVLEVKSCTLFGRKVAMFPDAVTERGRRHVEELSRLPDGMEGAVLFLVQSQGMEAFLPEFHTDPLFSEALYRARDRIMVIPLSIGWREDLTLSGEVKPLPIPWEKVKEGLEDRGVYILILKLPEERTVRIGGLGDVFFRRGYYLYVGSARRNLSKRIDRHKRKRKRLRWHIDYLREVSRFHASLPVRTGEGMECLLAEALRGIGEGIHGFGSSDCSCPSHLFFFEDDPLHLGSFHSILHHFRMDRLLGEEEDHPLLKQDALSLHL